MAQNSTKNSSVVKGIKKSASVNQASEKVVSAKQKNVKKSNEQGVKAKAYKGVLQLPTLQKAIDLHHAGKLREAWGLYQEVLKRIRSIIWPLKTWD